MPDHDIATDQKRLSKKKNYHLYPGGDLSLALFTPYRTRSRFWLLLLLELFGVGSDIDRQVG